MTDDRKEDNLEVIVEDDTKLDLVVKENGKTNVENKTNDNVKSNDDNALEKVKRKIAPTLKSSSVFFYGIQLSMFLIGCINVNNCPLNKMIPIYLIVAGVAGIFTNVLLKTSNKYLFNSLLILIVFDFVWHALGSYWVYVEYQPNYDSRKGIHCNRLPYLLAFWMLTIQSTLLILTLLLISCYLLMKDDFRN